MRLASVIGLILLASLASALCNATLEGVVVGTSYGCPDGVPPEQARVYVGEDYHICGEVLLNGVSLTDGEVSGYEERIMQSSAPIDNGEFSIAGSANTNEHRVYFPVLSLESPCEKEFEPIALEVRNSCLMVPPANIEAIPNPVMQGEDFLLEVRNVREETVMSVTGLETPISAVIPAGGMWVQSFPHTACAEVGACTLAFSFTEAKHPICKSSSNMAIEVRPPGEASKPGAEEPTPLIAGVLVVIIIGTAGAVLMHRYI